MKRLKTLRGRMERPEFSVDIVSANRELRVGPSLDHILCARLDATAKNCAGRVDIVPASFSYEWKGATASLLLFSFRVDHAQRVARSMGLTMPAEFVAPLLDVRDPRIFHAASALNQAITAGVPNSNAVIGGLARAMIAQFVRRCSRRDFRAKLEDRCLSKILRHIDTNLDRNLAIGDLAALGNMTQSRFRMLMRLRLGMSPHQYVLRRRTARAIGMLSEGQSNFGEVARMCGFANQSHMARIVRAAAGVTPRSIRK